MDARGLHDCARHAVEAVERVHDHGDEPEHEADQYLRHVAEAEDHDEQRIERIDRNGVVGGKQGIERFAQSAPAMDQRAKDNANDNR